MMSITWTFAYDKFESLASIRTRNCCPCMTLPLPPLSSMHNLRYKTTLENKICSFFCSPKFGLPMSFFLSPSGWIFPLRRGSSSSLLILPGLLRSDRGGLSVSSPSGEREDACGLRRWCYTLPWNFIQPLFSTEFPHWAILILLFFKSLINIYK